MGARGTDLGDAFAKDFSLVVVVVATIVIVDEDGVGVINERDATEPDIALMVTTIITSIPISISSPHPTPPNFRHIPARHPPPHLPQHLPLLPIHFHQPLLQFLRILLHLYQLIPDLIDLLQLVEVVLEVSLLALELVLGEVELVGELGDCLLVLEQAIELV